MHKQEFLLENKKHILLREFEIQMDQLVQTKRLAVVLIKKKKRSYHILNFAVSAILRESKMLNKNLDSARAQKIIWDMNVLVILVVVKACKRFHKNLEQIR